MDIAECLIAICKRMQHLFSVSCINKTIDVDGYYSGQSMNFTGQDQESLPKMVFFSDTPFNHQLMSWIWPVQTFFEVSMKI